MSKTITSFTQKIELLATKLNIIYNFAQKYYLNVIRYEIVLGEITEKDHILCIGGGFCPFSAILFHQMTGAKVTIIDYNTECVHKAQKFIEKKGLSDYIKLYCRNGCCPELDFNEYTIIHLALQVAPLNEVLDEMKKRILSGTKILIRRPKEILNKLYCHFTIETFGCSSCIEHNKACNIGSTYLYLKE